MKPIDFISISLARTGTTWLRNNLNCHPDILAMGETWGFNLHTTKDRLNFWDLSIKAFKNKEFKIKGDISPSYALLTNEEIEICKKCCPDLKLIFILREPVSRTWSHLKHMQSHREGYFEKEENDFAKSLTDPYTTINSNYLLVLHKWQTHFSNIFIYFYENMVANPEMFFDKLFKFLNVESVDISKFPAHEIINNSIPLKIPNDIEKYLFSLYQTEALQLINHLEIKEYPSQWEKILTSEELLIQTQKRIISKVHTFEYFHKTTKKTDPFLL